MANHRVDAYRMTPESYPKCGIDTPPAGLGPHHLAQFLAGELTAEKTMKQIADGWNAKTDELGRDAQLAAYKDTLGVKK